MGRAAAATVTHGQCKRCAERRASGGQAHILRCFCFSIFSNCAMYCAIILSSRVAAEEMAEAAGAAAALPSSVARGDDDSGLAVVVTDSLLPLLSRSSFTATRPPRFEAFSAVFDVFCFVGRGSSSVAMRSSSESSRAVANGFALRLRSHSCCISKLRKGRWYRAPRSHLVLQSRVTHVHKSERSRVGRSRRAEQRLVGPTACAAACCGRPTRSV